MTANNDIANKVDDSQMMDMAARLVHALETAESDEVKLALLNSVAARLGAVGFPAFIKLLVMVSDSGYQKGQRLLADSLVLGVKRSDLPSGDLTAWGVDHAATMDKPFLAGDIQRFASPRRKFDPIEYLVVWRCQKTQHPYLSDDIFAETLLGLIKLLSHNAEACQVYPAKIQDDLDRSLEGAYMSRSRLCLQALSSTWCENSLPEEVVAAALSC